MYICHSNRESYFKRWHFHPMKMVSVKTPFGAEVSLAPDTPKFPIKRYFTGDCVSLVLTKSNNTIFPSHFT